MSTTRTIAVTGASEQDAARISSLLEKHRNKLSTPWENGEAAHADLLVVDIESMYGQMDWLRARSRGRLVVAYTSATEPLEPEFSLRKPVVSADLVTLLNRIAENMGNGKAEATPMRPANAESYEAPPAPKAEVVRIAERKPAAAASPIESKPIAAVVEAPAEITVSPVQTHRVDELIAVLDAADGPVRLVHEGLPSIIIDPVRQRWYAGVALKALWDWAKLPLRRSELIHLNAAEFAAATEILSAQPFARLVWFAHLARSEGQLDAGLPADGRYRLTRWPQVEREFPKHFRIATAMMSGSGTVEDIAAQSKAGAGDVVEFINAYNALGYVECEALLPVTSPGDRTGLLDRVRKSLRN